MAGSLAHFLNNQTKQYQTSLRKCETLRQALAEQQNIKRIRQIPSKCTPNTLVLAIPASTKQFVEKYERLFFEHLQKTIKNNVTELKAQQATKQINSHCS